MDVVEVLHPSRDVVPLCTVGDPPWEAVAAVVALGHEGMVPRVERGHVSEKKENCYFFKECPVLLIPIKFHGFSEANNKCAYSATQSLILF